MEIEAKIKKWNLIELKSFCTTKETISKVKRQLSRWEKITANEATDNELILKINKQLMQLSTRKINNQIKKMGQRTKQMFLRRQTDGWQTHEKMLNITHYQRNANQNHNEVPFHAGQKLLSKCLQKIKTKINKWNLIKLKSFYTTKETISKTKQNPQNRKYLQKMWPTKD